MVTRTVSYSLRAGAPQPKKGSCTTLNEPAPSTIGFCLQTFMATRSQTDTCEDQDQLLCSNDMLGLGGDYVSASYTAQRFFDPATDSLVFTATETREEEIISEDDVPGASLL